MENLVYLQPAKNKETRYEDTFEKFEQNLTYKFIKFAKLL
jgi:hypothetical protein